MLHAEAMIGNACAAAAFDDFGPVEWREGLDALTRSCNTDADLSPLGLAALENQIEMSLRNRLEVQRWHRENTASVEPVRAPLVVLGLPRTGTTLLSYLLDCDPENRSLLRWEAFASVPPPRREELRTDPRIAVADAQMDALYDLAPEFRAIHYEVGAGPTECVTLLGQDFRSVHFETMANIAGYAEWFDDCDMTSAYAFHQQVLQTLQSDAPGRWVLKSPCHNLALDALEATYPDAVFVATHRDPLAVTASTMSLVSVLSGISTDADFDEYIGSRWLNLTGHMIDEYLRHRASWSGEQFIDIGYRELATDPIARIAMLYDELGWTLTPKAETAMRDWLAQNPQGRFGRHDYSLDGFGVTEAEVRDRFADYYAAFDLS